MEPLTACREPDIVGSVIALIVITISFVNLFIIGFISCLKLRKMTKLNSIMKWLFYLTFIFSCSSELCHSVVILLCQFIDSDLNERDMNKLRGLHITMYMLVLMSLILTLITRLNITFRDSIYRLSNLQRIILILLIILLLLSGTSFALGLFIDEFPANFEASLIAAIIYTITTVYSVALFAYKIMKLVNVRAASVKNVMDENAIKLNKSQTKFIGQASKYLSLLGIATLSSMITVTTLSVVIATQSKWIGYIMGIHISIDTLMNMILLCLQYPFAKHYYDKYCKWTNKLCTIILMTKAQRMMQSQYKMKSLESHISQEVENGQNR